MNTGINVKIRFAPDSILKGELTLHNVTEIHYNYPSMMNQLADTAMIAFESDIHNTGLTYAIRDVAEFETEPATNEHEEF